MSEFQDAVVVVTGGASGIGLATARLFASCGALVTVADIGPGVEVAVEDIRVHGGRAEAVQMDAGDEAAVERLMRETLSRHGRIDFVHANAGISGGARGLFEQSADDWASLLKTNLIGPFLAIKYAAPLLEARRGSIVCTASVAGFLSGAGAGGPAYSASKAGVISLVKLAAQQLSGTGVRVNAVCPGLIETGMTQAIYDGARAINKEDRIGQLNPLQRGGTSEEIASAVMFLASRAASYVNGHALVVDGGLSTSMPVSRVGRQS